MMWVGLPQLISLLVSHTIHPKALFAMTSLSAMESAGLVPNGLMTPTTFWSA
jgi:hypothetical protein